MPKLGSRPSPAKSTADEFPAMAAALALLAIIPSQVGAQVLRTYEIVGDAIPEPLTGVRGDPARGRAIVVDRQKGLCLLCHAGPFPEQRFQGNLAPDLTGVGTRWSEGQLRLKIVDSRQLNPATIMPPYYNMDGLVRVGRNWQDKPVLSAEQVEDVVAFLTTLTETP
jgi:L-cysteine S-thiosulfotransferase